MARAGDHGGPGEILAEEEAVTEAIHSAAHPGRKRDDEGGEAGESGDEADGGKDGAA